MTDPCRDLKHGDTIECDDASRTRPDGSGLPCEWCAGFHAGYILGEEAERERVRSLVDDCLGYIDEGMD